MDMEKLSYIKQPLQCFTTYSRKKTEREREREREREDKWNDETAFV